MIFFIFFVGFIFSQTQLADGVVAVVGNQTVLLSDIKDEVDLISKEKKIPPSSSLYVDLFNSVLEKNINNKVILIFAKQDSSLIVSYDEVKQILDERVDFYIQRFGSVDSFEKTVGMTIGEMKEKNWKTIEDELLIEKYRMKNFANVKITKHDVFKFYEEYKDSLPKTPSVGSFSVLEKKIEPSEKNKNRFLKTSSELIDSLRLGFLDFTETAMNRSVDPSVINNKGIMLTNRGDLVPEYEKEAYLLTEGQISNLTESPFGYHIIKLLEKKGEKIKTQHILLSLPLKKEDIENSYLYLEKIKEQTLNDPGVFDSLSFISNVGFSGFYENKDLNIFPFYIKNFIESGENYSFSDLIKNDEYVSLIYKYSFTNQEIKTLENSWFELENLALNKKRFDEFELWIKQKRENLYIFISDF